MVPTLFPMILIHTQTFVLLLVLFGLFQTILTEAHGSNVQMFQTSLTEASSIRMHVKVKPSDDIMNRRTYASPIVHEKFRLIFFPIQKVGCTVWKQLLRRMLGLADWRTGRTWGRNTGLKYLADYHLKRATELMNDPLYTRTVFLRDPKERFLSAFADKAIRTDYFYRKCLRRCRPSARCRINSQNFSYFVEITRKHCKDTHWGSQSANVESKYLHTLDFVGHLETAETDARTVLKHIGAWEQYGKYGWGKYGNESIFASTSFVKHKTSLGTSYERLKKHYTPEIENEIEDRFAEDYKRTAYGLQLKRINHTRLRLA